MHGIRPAEKSELRAALSVLLARPETSYDELNRQIDTLVRYAERQNLSLAECLVRGERGQIEAACLCVDAPGRTSSVFIPNQVSTPERGRMITEILCEQVSRAQGRGVRLMQGMVAPECALENDLFAHAGFRHLTQLIYLERDVVAPLPRLRPSPAVTWEEYSPRTHKAFARVVEGTYAGSLDCAALGGVRDIEDTLAGHRASGEFDARFWLLARAFDEPIGVLLLARVPERASTEVVYMGLIPRARGQGFGVTLLRRALDTARLQGSAFVTLTVDVENSPARALYSTFGFHESSRREVWMRILPDAHLQLEPDSASDS